MLCCSKETVPQEESDAATAERAAAADGANVKGEADREGAKEEMPEPKKVSVAPII